MFRESLIEDDDGLDSAPDKAAAGSDNPFAYRDSEETVERFVDKNRAFIRRTDPTEFRIRVGKQKRLVVGFRRNP